MFKNNLLLFSFARFEFGVLDLPCLTFAIRVDLYLHCLTFVIRVDPQTFLLLDRRVLEV